MFIAIDVGNSNITVGVWQDEAWHEYRIASDQTQSLSYYAQELSVVTNKHGKSGVEGVGVSCVVPDLTEIILVAAKMEFGGEPILFNKKWYHLLPITTANPEQMGTDLLANALAGYCKKQGPCLIVDFGTALTYTLVNPNNKLDGVAIAPGIRTAMKSLSGNAAQLPDIPLELPKKLLGSNTVEAMNSGILWGFVGQVTFMVDKIRSETAYDLITIATGGLSKVLKPLEDKFDIIDPNLTVQGIYEFFKLVKADQQIANHED
jgi:type III pantothenate kinase